LEEQSILATRAEKGALFCHKKNAMKVFNATKRWDWKFLSLHNTEKEKIRLIN